MTGSYASARMTGSSALRRLRALARGFSPAPSAWRPAALGCVALLLAGAHGAEAGVNVWTSLGPPGGPPRALVVDPTRPGTLYVGTTFDGLFKSEDGGDTWSATGLTGSVLALAILPGNPMRLYAGGYDGIFRSTDGGGTWTAVYSTTRVFEQVATLAVDATGTLYAGTGACSCDERSCGVDCSGGVLTSTDGGNNWQSTGLIDTPVATLAIDATVPGTLYAGTLDDFGSQRAIVFKSTDGGTTWMNTDLPDSTGSVAVAIDPTTPRTVYAGTSDGHIFKTTDGGARWTAASAGLPDMIAVLALATDPSTPRTVYAGMQDGRVFKTTDGGAMWTAASAGLPDDAGSVALGIDPTTPGALYAGTGRGGVFKSTDAGGTWVATGFRGGRQVYALTVDPTAARTLYAATDGAGAVFKTTDGGGTWGPASTGLPDHAGVVALAIDSTMPTTLYAGTADDVYKSMDGGGTWNATGLTSNVLALAIDPVTPTTLYAATGDYDELPANAGVFKSTDAGATWAAANTGLGNAPIVALAVDPATPSTIYAGTGIDNCDFGCSGGGVVKTTDGGNTWNAASTGLPDGAIVNALAIDPSTPRTVYAGTYLTGVFKTTDGGATWTAADAGLPLVLALAIDPTRAGTLYAGTEGGGVFKSTDGGRTWGPLNPGLTYGLSIQALALDPATPNRLYAGTSGAGVFVIEQVCVGDCSGDGVVTIDELVIAVSVALGRPRPSACQSLDTDGNETLTVDELIAAVNASLNGCI